ncbi:MAG: maleylpyruvate isomerase N-terminal domain-containing protein [Chloroflexi bacterium]|nr:maleylpyruvate isomerase N-terminal domain-containing protein [Chloroflexota bacterium]
MPQTLELAEKLKTEGDNIIRFFSEMKENQWRTEVYAEGEVWTVRSVLSHFVASERGLVKLFESIRQGGAGSADDFSIDRYNTQRQEKTKDLTPAELLKQYKNARGATVNWVSGLKDEELDIKGRHPFLGETVLREMIKMLYLHNQIHCRDIKKALKETAQRA